jgi:hypothetical protein
MPTKEGAQVAFSATSAVVDGSETISSVAAAYDRALHVTAAVKAMEPAVRHERTVVEVAR